MQRFETDVHFECPVCGKHAETSVAVPEPDWGAAEDMSDLTSEDQTEVTCNECGTEFPAYVYNSAGSCDVTLDEYPDTVIHADLAFFSPPDDDDWMDVNVPEEPFDIFMNSYHRTGDILAEHGGEYGANLINRMVFAQQVSALEAYLGDTLQKYVDEKPDAMLRLLKEDKELAKQSFPIIEVAEKTNLVRDAVQSYLRAIIYHNLPKVDFLYSAAFGIRILRDKEDNAKLLQAIIHRHDCVHRNGMDKNGVALTVFTKEYVQETADLMRRLVESIEADISK